MQARAASPGRRTAPDSRLSWEGELVPDRKQPEMANQLSPIVKAQMLIRRPVSEVFQAFVDPAVTTKFWFTKSSGPLPQKSPLRPSMRKAASRSCWLA